MPSTLQGKRVAILATDGVEQVEFTKPRDALREAGAQVDVISIKSDPIQAFQHLDKGDTFPVDREVVGRHRGRLRRARAAGRGGQPRLPAHGPEAVAFVHEFFEQGKPVGVICHGPWTLIEADVVRGRTLDLVAVAAEPDLRNAGATWVDQEVVVDQGLVSSRKPDDLPAFCSKLVEEFAEGAHVGQHA